MSAEPKKIRKYCFIFPLLALFLVGVMLFLGRDRSKFLLSPLAKTGFKFFSKDKKLEVVGFLPYWNLKESTKVDFEVVDQLIYFGLMIDENGDILRQEEGGLEPGWRNLHSQRLASFIQKAREKKKKVLLSVASFDAQIIREVIADKEKQNKLIAEIIDLTLQRNFDGVNIDFEYFPQIDDQEFAKNFNSFLKDLKLKLKKSKAESIVSVDIYPKAFILGEPYDLEDMGGIVDQVIMMAYDFTQSNSERAGPVAPLNKAPEDEYSIFQALKASFNKVTPEKLILGIPLYGYEWTTYDENHRSLAYPQSGVTASYRRVKQLINERGLRVYWDATASSPWLFYEEEGENRQIYFENLQSLALKVSLAKQLKLGGVAFWALGYEGEDEELWERLKKEL